MSVRLQDVKQSLRIITARINEAKEYEEQVDAKSFIANRNRTQTPHKLKFHPFRQPQDDLEHGGNQEATEQTPSIKHDTSKWVSLSMNSQMTIKSPRASVETRKTLPSRRFRTCESSSTTWNDQPQEPPVDNQIATNRDEVVAQIKSTISNQEETQQRVSPTVPDLVTVVDPEEPMDEDNRFRRLSRVLADPYEALLHLHRSREPQQDQNPEAASSPLRRRRPSPEPLITHRQADDDDDDAMWKSIRSPLARRDTKPKRRSPAAPSESATRTEPTPRPSLPASLLVTKWSKDQLYEYNTLLSFLEDHLARPDDRLLPPACIDQILAFLKSIQPKLATV